MPSLMTVSSHSADTVEFSAASGLSRLRFARRLRRLRRVA
jgi:hypothetical protein